MYNISIKKIHGWSVCFLAIVLGAFTLPTLVHAQTGTPAEGADGRVVAIPYDIEKNAFPDNKQGCEMRSSLFVAFADNYRNGKSSKGLFQFKMLEPLGDKIDERIRRKGLEKASIENMKEYASCIKHAGIHKNAKKERDLALKHSACVKFNAIILETIDGIKRRRKPESLMMKYEKKSPDMTWTNYAIIPDTALYAIAKLYKISQTKKYGDVVHAASNMSANCYL